MKKFIWLLKINEHLSFFTDCIIPYALDPIQSYEKVFMLKSASYSHWNDE